MCVSDLGLTLVNKVEQSCVRNSAKEEDLAAGIGSVSVLDANEAEYPTLGRTRLDSRMSLDAILSAEPKAVLNLCGRWLSSV